MRRRDAGEPSRSSPSLLLRSAARHHHRAAVLGRALRRALVFVTLMLVVRELHSWRLRAWARDTENWATTGGVGSSVKLVQPTADGGGGGGGRRRRRASPAFVAANVTTEANVDE